MTRYDSRLDSLEAQLSEAHGTALVFGRERELSSRYTVEQGGHDPDTPRLYCIIKLKSSQHGGKLKAIALHESDIDLL